MFNALNRFISRLDGDPQAQRDSSSTLGAFGFQVLRNKDAHLAIEPWFDFIVGINGRTIDNPDLNLFAQEVRNCAGGSVMLGLWSAKGQRTRSMHVAVPADASSLGLALQWTPLADVFNVWHVLDIAPRSPAEEAGLLPYSDYILGTPASVLHGGSGLGELIEDHIGQALTLWVYNHEFDVARELTIQPRRDWDGEGALGCVLGYGALHRLPPPLSEPVHAPGETLFDGDAEKTTGGGGVGGAAAFETVSGPGAAGADSSSTFVPAAAAESSSSADFLVPAQMVGAPPMSAPTARSKKKERRTPGQKDFMDEYLKEEAAKSKELDNPPSRSHTPVAPPPKAGAGGGPPPPAAGGPPKGGPPKAGTPTPAAAAETEGGEDRD